MKLVLSKKKESVQLKAENLTKDNKSTLTVTDDPAKEFQLDKDELVTNQSPLKTLHL